MFQLLALSIAGAVGVCVVLMLIAWRPWRPDAALAGGRWGGAAAFTLALMPAYLLGERWPGLPPSESWQWIVYVLLVSGAVGAADSSRRWPAAVRVAVYVLPAGVAGAVLVGDWVESPWLWRAVTGLLVLVTHAVINDAGERCRGGSVPLALLVAATCASIVILEANSAKLFQLSAALAAGLGVCTVLAWWRPAVSLARGAAPVIAVALTGLVLSAKFLTYAPIPVWSFVLVSAAPLGLLAARVAPGQRRRPWIAAAVRVIAVLVPAGVAAAAAVASAAADSPYGY